MRHIARLTAAVCLPVLLAACGNLPQGAALRSEVLAQQDAEVPDFQVVPVTRDYVPLISSWPGTGYRSFEWIGTGGGTDAALIAPGDVINLVIFDSQDNSLLTSIGQRSTTIDGIQVDENGAIFMPYVDRVKIAGLTPSGARTRIQRMLENIAPTVQVILTMQEGIRNSVDIAGGVTNPGSYPMKSRNFKILGLISQSGGIQTGLRNPVVRLLRGGATYEIFAEDLFATGKANTVLKPGDTVIVEADDRSFTALGATGTEDLIYFPKPQVTALEAVSLMGGLTDQRADPEGVLILREYPASALSADGRGPTHQQVIFTFDLTSADGLFAARNFRVHPGDTVLATESPVTKAQTVFGLFGSVLGLGRQVQVATN